MKKRIAAFTVCFCTFIALLPLFTIVTGAVEIAKWQGFRKTAVIFTFDNGGDQTASHAWIAEQFDKYGFKATFNVVTNWMDSSSWATYKALAENGHEIGSQTVSNTVSGGALELSKLIIEQNIGRPCLTIAYPNGNNPGASYVSKYYIAGRTAVSDFTSSSPYDFYSLPAFIIGTSSALDSAQTIALKISQAQSYGRAVIFRGDKVVGCAGGSTFSPIYETTLTDTLEHLNANNNDYWVTSLSNAMLYSIERDNCEFQKISATTDTDIYRLWVTTDQKWS